MESRDSGCALQALDPAALSAELQRRIDSLRKLQEQAQGPPMHAPAPPMRSHSAASALSGRETAFGAPVRRRQTNVADAPTHTSSAAAASFTASGNAPPRGPFAGRYISQGVGAAGLAALPQPLPAERLVPQGARASASTAQQQPRPLALPAQLPVQVPGMNDAGRAAEAAAQALATAELLGIDAQPCPVRCASLDWNHFDATTLHRSHPLGRCDLSHI
jgi:hypothetical protein